MTPQGQPPHRIAPEAPRVKRLTALARGAVLQEEAGTKVSRLDAAAGVETPRRVDQHGGTRLPSHAHRCRKATLRLDLRILEARVVAFLGRTFAPDGGDDPLAFRGRNEKERTV